MRRQKVLCVSFDMAVSDIRRAALNEAGYAVTTTTDVKEALNFLSREKFDLVIVGHRFATPDKYVLTDPQRTGLRGAQANAGIVLTH